MGPERGMPGHSNLSYCMHFLEDEMYVVHSKSLREECVYAVDVASESHPLEV